jgi:hypothetical protein
LCRSYFVLDKKVNLKSNKIIIFRFRWTLAKSLEFLTNKKFDVEIPKYFLNQLSFYESRLSKLGVGPRTTTWQDTGTDSDPDELLMRNTYLNGLAQKNEKKENLSKPYVYTGKKVVWTDNSINRNPLCSTNLGRELIYMKDIKPVMSHKKMKPVKSCLKTRSHSADVKKPNTYISNVIPSQGDSTSINNLNSSKIIGSSFNYGLNNNGSLKDIHQSQNMQNSNSMQMGNYSNNNLNSQMNQNNSGLNPSSSGNKMMPSVGFNESISTLNSNIKATTTSSSNELLKNYTNLGQNIYDSKSSMNSMNSMNNMNSMNSMNSGNMPLSHLNITGNSGSSQNINSNSTNYNSSLKSQGQNVNNYSNLNSNPSPNTRQNNFTVNSNSAQQRSYSVGNDPSKNQATTPSGETKIIIASKYKNVIHNSYNNIYIQNPEDLEKIYSTGSGASQVANYENQQMNMGQKLINKKESPGTNSNQIPSIQYVGNRGNSNNNLNTFINPMNKSQINENMNSYIKGDPNMINASSGNVLGNNNMSNMQQMQVNKLSKTGENQRMLQNNFFMNNTSTASNVMD